VCVAIGTCGNGVIDPGEQCDDGNRLDLDGCDSNCRYEMVTRLNSFVVQNGTAPSWCTPTRNAFGNALTSTLIGQLNPQIQTELNNGTLNTFLQFLGLNDLTGNTNGNLSVGFLRGSLDPAKGTWPSGGAVDWWFLASHNEVSNGLPAALLPASLSAHTLTAGPGAAVLPLLGGSFAAQQVQAHATIDATPAPNVPAPPPAQLAPGLTVFQHVTGSLCGNITVESLGQIPLPQSLASGGSDPCGNRTYAYCGLGQPVTPSCASLLDVLVGGCNVFAGLINVITPTQPDVPVSGGSVQTLALGANNKVSINTTGDLDAYSSYFTFTALRAHFTGQDCAATADCQAGQTCVSNKCQ
jgi:cysteine-rich repeat protein